MTNGYDEFALCAVSLVGLAMVLIGCYRRYDGISVLFLLLGLVVLVSGMASWAGYEAVYGG